MSTDDPFLSYIPLNAEYEVVSAAFARSYGSSAYCISALFRVENPALQTEFDACYAAIAAVRSSKPTVVSMFHGTTMEAVHSIAAHGFDPAYSRIAAYGKGTYASPSVKTALGYCKDVKTHDDFSMVFLCDVITGVHGKPNKANVLDTSNADHGGNGREIFVTPHRYGILPKYLICFYKWAA